MSEPPYAGCFELRNARDLLGKLEHDFARLQVEPGDSYIAYDLFVTAHHLAEWVFSGDEDAARAYRKEHEVLRVCDHLANGAKHCVLKSASRTDGTRNVAATTRKRGFSREFSDDFARPQLEIHLKSTETTLPNPIGALDLAGRVLQHWREHPTLQRLET